MTTTTTTAMGADDTLVVARRPHCITRSDSLFQLPRRRHHMPPTPRLPPTNRREVPQARLTDPPPSPPPLSLNLRSPPILVPPARSLGRNTLSSISLSRPSHAIRIPAATSRAFPGPRE
ncbi:hypothetical protein JAAARDRAFT_706814 [Jaapia argillacea MUCL 33604]|uniref:Uncharacterized protein n=1 Tax=Jaapia argillacea MUCL 33604 TaxID=933084 RepID=A0A067PKP4_9AGAM|nr:hypothetical protein JAAARDRAFT_706814 [Jaapia argillacea MUCL 33604]